MMRSPFAILAVVAGTAAMGQEVDHIVHDAFIGTFYRMCLNDGFRAHLMFALAEGEGWRELPPETMRQFVEDSVDASWLRGWVVDLPEEAPQFIGIAGRTPAGTVPEIEVCAAFFPRLPGDYFVHALESDAAAKVIARSPLQDGWKYEITIPDLPNAATVVAAWPPAASGPGGVYAAVTFWGRQR